ncbi:DUF6507 family protein [Actinomadura sp. NPDC047616]|uniref:DUF6507 family protein n=1 Tax=Actinomadura sp. NPDC047616 TaxID=3155914 RepID=UPI0034006754
MTSYGIDDGGVLGELRRAAAASQPLWKHDKAFFTHLKEAGTACRSEIVSAALLRFGTQARTRVNGMESRINRAVTKTSEATSYYVAADHEMGERARRYARRAAAAQRAAIEAPGPNGLYKHK